MPKPYFFNKKEAAKKGDESEKSNRFAKRKGKRGKKRSGARRG